MSSEEVKGYRPGDKVLAYHGPLIYEAKILKLHEKSKTFIEDKDGKHEPLEGSNLPEELYDLEAYFVHYKGWKPKWDEWVANERLLEYNDENLQAQKELKEKTRRERVKPKAPKGEPGQVGRKRNLLVMHSGGGGQQPQLLPKPGRPPGGPGAPKRKKLDGSTTSSSRGSHEISIPLRPELKYILVDDWEFITKDRRIVDIPSPVPVTKIISDYYHHKQKVDTANLNIVNEVVHGLEIYFNKSLSLILLYKLERLQYLHLLKQDPHLKPAQVYGVEHLLRLFVSLPGLIAQTAMDPVSIGVLVKQCKDMLEYVCDNLSRYTNEYINVSPAYDSLARS